MAVELEALDPREVVALIARPPALDKLPDGRDALQTLMTDLENYRMASERAVAEAAARAEHLGREVEDLNARLAEAERRISAYEGMRQQLKKLVLD